MALATIDLIRDVFSPSHEEVNGSPSTRALATLRGELRGELCLPSEAGYDEARTIWNAMIDRRPAAILRAAGASDVVATVRLAAQYGLLLSVRGGGHNIAGNAVCDGGLMLDLSRMKSVQVDSAARTALVGPGALLSDLDRVLLTECILQPNPLTAAREFRNRWR